jgi:hypothetical protein
MKTNRSRGDAICSNVRTISERKLADGVVRALKELLTKPDLIARFVDTFSKRFDQVLRGTDAETEEEALAAAKARRAAASRDERPKILPIPR